MPLSMPLRLLAEIVSVSPARPPAQKPDFTPMRPIITLTTDFGEREPYVAAMKGVILSICPQAHIVDLSHAIAPQDVLEGALFLAGSMPYWPAGTIHVAVVDPGVGSERQVIAMESDGHLFLAPDNGVLAAVE